jgi:Fe2+ transport system protein FeoA
MEQSGLRLSELAVGDCAEIVRVGAVGEIKKRLLEMGVVPGARLKVERLAPLGDPLEVFIMGYHLSLRMSEAREITVKRTA